MRYACLSVAVLSSFVLVVSGEMASANGPKSTGSAYAGHRPAAPPHRPPVAPPRAVYGSDRLVPAPQPPAPVQQQVILQPFVGAGFSYPYLRESDLLRPVIIEEPLPSRAARRRAAQQPVFIPMPSGRQGGYREARAPYAPPAIYIIGEPSRRHMRGPVHLNHGVKAQRGRQLDPQVVWLEKAPQGRGVRVVKAAE